MGAFDFEDEHRDMDAIRARQEAGAPPFQSLPALTVDGEVYAESAAILRYTGKLARLYPKRGKTEMKVDMIADTLETVVLLAVQESSQVALEKLLKETILRYIGGTNKIHAKEKGPYPLADKISIADLKLFPIVMGLNKGVQFDHVPAGCLDKYAHVMAAVKAVGEHPKVKEWNAMHA